MNFRIRRIRELLQHIAARCFSQYLLGLGDGSRHPFRSRRKDNFGSESPQENAPLQAHSLRHGKDQPVPPHRRHQRKPDTGIAAGRLDQDSLARLDFSLPLSFVDHADADAVFHARARIEALKLGGHRRFRTFCNPVQTHQRSFSDQFGHVIGDLHECSVKF